MTVNKITNAPTQNKIINTVNDLIDNKQDTLIAGTDLEIIPAQAPILPEGFTQIEYIEGTGTQYIDTGFYGTQNSGAYIRFALTDLTSEGSARVFGTRNGTAGTKAFAFISSYDGSSLPSDKFYIGSNGYASWPANLDTNWHEVSCNIENDKKVYFDGNLIITGGNTAYTSTAQASIFRRYNQNTYSGKSATAKISILQIYENAVMVHNFIPCRRDSDDELGMYDLVSNTFFTNSGTGTFIAGPDTVFPETDLINFTNESGYIKGIDSTDVTTALGYTPYNSTNPNNYTSNVGTVTSVNNTQPDANGDVTLTMPTVNDGVLTITQNGTSKGTFSANQSTNDTIALTDTTYNAFTGADGTNAGSSGLVPAPSATDNDKYLKGDGTWASVSGGSSTDVQINSTSITNQGVANILTQTAYNASSNKIATMSDIPADKIFIATYGTTTFNEVWTAYDAGKTVFVKDDTTTPASAFGGILAILNYFEFNSALDAHFEFASSILNDGTYYTYTLDQDSIWSEYTEQIPDTSGFANTDLSNLTATGEAHFQEPLVSGTNIKTINNTSLLGSGDISVGSYSAGTGLSLSGTTFNHSNSVTAGTIGTSSATSGSTISVPYATYDAQGHITGKGTHTHTVTGFLTSSSTQVASSRFDGQWVAKKSTLTTSTAIDTYTLDLVNYLPSGGDKYEVLVAFNIVSKDTSPSNTRLYSDIISISTDYLNQKTPSPSHWLQNGCLLILPVTRYLYFVIENHATGAGTTITAVGYRRIGTNT